MAKKQPGMHQIRSVISEPFLSILLDCICNAEGDVDQWYLVHMFEMNHLIIKEYMGFHDFQDPFLLDASQKESLIN